LVTFPILNIPQPLKASINLLAEAAFKVISGLGKTLPPVC